MTIETRLRRLEEAEAAAVEQTAATRIADPGLLALLEASEPIPGDWPTVGHAVRAVLADPERVERELALDDAFLADPLSVGEPGDVTKPEAGQIAT